MKKKLWKLFTPIALIAVLVFSTIFATGCYIIRSVKMTDLVGTYELTRYTAKTDILAEREIKLYMIIKSDGSGYYVYKDKDTALYASEMRFSFETDPEESSKYEYVHAQFNLQDETVKFGVNGKNLNYNKIVWKQLTLENFKLEQDYTIDVDFNKVSEKTDLSYVNDVFDTNLTALPYGLARLAYTYQSHGPKWNESYLNKAEMLQFDQEMPLYNYVSVDVFNNKAKFYYAYPSENQPLTREFDITVTSTTEAGTFTITAENYSATITSSKYSTRLIIEQAVQDKEGNAQTLVWEYSQYVELNYDLTEMINNSIASQTEQEEYCALREHEWSTDLCDQDKICWNCNLIKAAKDHSYDDNNDTVCNVCENTRELPQQTPEGDANE